MPPEIVEAIVSLRSELSSQAHDAGAETIAFHLAQRHKDVPSVKLLGIGMATAILVDATVVRMALVPAAMQLLGGANWWLPGWLDRILPQLDPEPARGGARPERGGRLRPDGIRLDDAEFRCA
jgi:uncharacterized membrane protein YdfJ with MMPL/SSD domain